MSQCVKCITMATAIPTIYRCVMYIYIYICVYTYMWIIKTLSCDVSGTVLFVLLKWHDRCLITHIWVWHLFMDYFENTNNNILVPARYHDIILNSRTPDGRFVNCEFSLDLNSSVGLQAVIQSAGDLVPETPKFESWSNGRKRLIFFRFEIPPLSQRTI